MKKIALFLLAATLIFGCKEEEKKETKVIPTKQFKSFPATADLLATFNIKGTAYEAFGNYMMIKVPEVSGRIRIVETGTLYVPAEDTYCLRINNGNTFTIDGIEVKVKGNIAYKFIIKEFPIKWEGKSAGELNKKYYLPGARYWFKGKKYNKFHQIPISSGVELPGREFASWENITVDIWCNVYNSGKKFPAEKNYKTIMETVNDMFVFDGTGQPGMRK